MMTNRNRRRKPTGYNKHQPPPVRCPACGTIGNIGRCCGDGLNEAVLKDKFEQQFQVGAYAQRRERGNDHQKSLNG